MKKEFACLKRPWKSTNNASNVLIIFPNGTLSSGLRLHKRSGILFMTDYLKEVVPILMGAFLADYVVLGGGNSKKLKGLPVRARLGHNLTAFRGGFRLWNLDGIHTLLTDERQSCSSQASIEWRLI
jgi:hypothetical protein